MDKFIEHESRLSKLEACVKIVMENHIPHIHDDIKEIKSWIKALAMAFITTALGLIAKVSIGG